MRGREDAAYTLGRLGVSRHNAEQVIRALPAIQRGKEAACNWVESVSGPIVEKGRKAAARVRVILTSLPTVAGIEVDGDPRGATVVVRIKDGFNEHLNGAGFTAAQMRRIDAAHAAGGVR